MHRTVCFRQPSAWNLRVKPPSADLSGFAALDNLSGQHLWQTTTSYIAANFRVAQASAVTPASNLWSVRAGDHCFDLDA